MSELPLAPAGCALSGVSLADQVQRAAALRPAVLGVRRDSTSAAIGFSSELDEPLLEELLDVERSCCSFFDLDWDPRVRILHVAIAGSEREPALLSFAALFEP